MSDLNGNVVEMSNESGFHIKLKSRREALGLSQYDLAKLTGFGQSRLSKWENDEGKPGPEQIFRLAKTLETTLEYLCNPDCDDPGLNHSEKTEDQIFLESLTERLGVKEVIRRALNSEVAEVTKKRADPLPPEEKADQPVYAKPVSTVVKKKPTRSTE